MINDEDQVMRSIRGNVEYLLTQVRQQVTTVTDFSSNHGKSRGLFYGFGCDR